MCLRENYLHVLLCSLVYKRVVRVFIQRSFHFIVHSFIVAGEEVGRGCALAQSSGENNVLPSARRGEQHIGWRVVVSFPRHFSQLSETPLSLGLKIQP